jgi:hypothetical protein
LWAEDERAGRFDRWQCAQQHHHRQQLVSACAARRARVDMTARLRQLLGREAFVDERRQDFVGQVFG